ncbi:MAG: Pyruvate, phosphate dikinase, partial [Candidatus Peregrinibacteria bacterium GW2011_GWA2_44_7]
TGEKIFYGEFLMNAQGEDVVAGIRTPIPIQKLEEEMPVVYQELLDIKDRLEQHYKDMQDIEFTIEEGRLFILQTRKGKRTSQASVQIAVDMVHEGMIDKKEALLRVDANQLKQLLHPSIDPKAHYQVIAQGLPASPGAATGQVVFCADEAYAKAQEGLKVILVRKETSPEDIHGMHAAQGILTSTGGNTSHAAVVARGMGKCCVAGCGTVRVNMAEKKFTVGEVVVHEGDMITLNGTTGEVILGEVPMCDPSLSGAFGQLMEWADEVRTLRIRTNADTAEDATVARDFGAEGIGLCRTEHMFFAEDRIPLMREMILSKDDPSAQKRALDKLLPVQKEDFIGIFEVMNGLPVTIRLFDPPLHEFLPRPDQIRQIEELSHELQLSVEALNELIVSLHEVNPMLGHRGCRLGISTPELYAMQIRAILMAGQECHTLGVNVIPFEYTLGTMIELPRACLTADQIARDADFFSFGTNDLTQMTFGFSRDDAGSFLPRYISEGILPEDPTASIDQEGVGVLMKMAVQLGRGVKKDLEIGICGEHGGDPRSVEFCHDIGLNYVSCSPYRVPIARLAAAQAALKN